MPNLTSFDSSKNKSDNDISNRIDFDFGEAVERVDSWVDGGIQLLPNIGVAFVVFFIFYYVARLAKTQTVKRAARRNRINLGEVLGGFVKWTVLLFGSLLAITIVIPSLKPGDLISGLGISSVAIGFAFKDILQNWLAGLLILIRQPFSINDQIEVNGHEGTVERIETRATILKTYDGVRIVIPNSDIYTNAVTVKTAYGLRRSEYDVGIGYGDGIDNACEVILKAISSVSEVKVDPLPQVLPWDLSASWVTLKVRWWTKSRQADVVAVHAKVLKAIKNALDDAGIDMPYDTQVQLFHDQTETTDGERGAQREGWPNSSDVAPKPRWKAEQIGK